MERWPLEAKVKVRKEEVRDVWKEGSQSVQDAVEEQEGEQWAVEVQQSEQEAVQKQWNHPPHEQASVSVPSHLDHL